MVLQARARPAAPADLDALDLFALPTSAAVLRDGDAEHVLIADGPRHLRLHLRGASVADGPVRLFYPLAGLRSLPPKLLLLTRLSALWRLHRLPRPLFPADPVVVRRVRALQAIDARLAGAGQRDIIIALFGPRMADARSFDSSRKRVARLLSLAEKRIEVGRRSFLSDG